MANNMAYFKDGHSEPIIILEISDRCDADVRHSVGYFTISFMLNNRRYEYRSERELEYVIVGNSECCIPHVSHAFYNEWDEFVDDIDYICVEDACNETVRLPDGGH